MESSKNKSTEEFKMAGNWDTQRTLLKSKYAQLTDSDLTYVPGKENELLTRVESRLNKDREEVINILRKGQPKTI